MTTIEINNIEYKLLYASRHGDSEIVSHEKFVGTGKNSNLFYVRKYHGNGTMETCYCLIDLQMCGIIQRWNRYSKRTSIASCINNENWHGIMISLYLNVY